MNELGALLRKLRGKRSLREISEISGVSHNYLSIVEKGVDPRTKTPVSPSPETLKKLSEAYNYDYEELMILAGYIPKKIDEDLEPHVALSDLRYNANKNNDELAKKELAGWESLLNVDDFMRDIDLSDEELFKKYNFVYRGRTLNEEKIKKILEFIRIMSE